MREIEMGRGKEVSVDIYYNVKMRTEKKILGGTKQLERQGRTREDE